MKDLKNINSFIFIIIFLLVITSFFLYENVFAKPESIPEITSFVVSPSQGNSLKLVWNSNDSDTIEVMDNTNQRLYKFGGATGYTFQGLVNGKSYEVMIRACDRINGLYDCTNWSPTRRAVAKELNNSNNNTNSNTNTNTNTNYTIGSASLSPTSFTYDGTLKRPTVIVKNTSGVTLKEGTNYKVVYSNNINAGTGTCLVTGLGNYKFSKTLTFKINPAGIKTVTLSSSSYTYDGKVKTPGVTVMNNKSSKLVNGRDYRVIYQSGRVNNGTYRVRIIGKGNYKFDKSLYYKINPKGTTLSKKDKTDDSITINIKKVSGVKYQVGYKKSSNKNYTYKNTEKTTYKISNLKQDTDYNIIVRTYKKVGNATYYSNFSSVKTIKTYSTEYIIKKKVKELKSYSSATTIKTYSGDNMKKVARIKSYHSEKDPQSFCMMNDKYVIQYSRHGSDSYARLISYTRSGKRLKTGPSFYAGHANGLACGNSASKIYSVNRGGSNCTVLNKSSFKKERTFNLPHGAYGIAYDDFTNQFYISGGGVVRVLNENFKQVRSIGIKRSYVHHQDVGAYHGLIFVSFTQSKYGNNYIDIYRSYDGKYLGSYHVTKGELEGAFVDKGYLIFLINFKNTSDDYIYKSTSKVSLP